MVLIMHAKMLSRRIDALNPGIQLSVQKDEIVWKQGTNVLLKNGTSRELLYAIGTNDIDVRFPLILEAGKSTYAHVDLSKVIIVLEFTDYQKSFSPEAKLYSLKKGKDYKDRKMALEVTISDGKYVVTSLKKGIDGIEQDYIVETSPSRIPEQKQTFKEELVAEAHKSANFVITNGSKDLDLLYAIGDDDRYLLDRKPGVLASGKTFYGKINLDRLVIALEYVDQSSRNYFISPRIYTLRKSFFNKYKNKRMNFRISGNKSTIMFIEQSSGEEFVTQGDILAKNKKNVSSKEKKDLNVRLITLVANEPKNRDERLAQVQFLIEQGAEVNTLVFGGMTLLYQALDSHDIPLALLLLNNGADVNGIFKNNDKKYGRVTVLMKAVENQLKQGNNLDYMPVIDALIKGGAEVNTQNDSGLTVLMMALEKNNVVLARKIMATKKVNLKLKDILGRTSGDYINSVSTQAVKDLSKEYPGLKPL